MFRSSILALAAAPLAVAGAWMTSDGKAKEGSTASCCSSAGVSQSGGPSAGELSATAIASSPAAAPAPAILQGAGIDPATAATVKGVIKFDGPPPERKPIDMQSVPDCHKLHPEKVLSEDVIVGANGLLRNVFVYVKKGLDDRKFDPPADPVVFDQKGCTYIPHVVGLQQGQTWKVTSSDPVMHNVHAYPKKSPQFNRAMPAGTSPIEHKFKAAETLVQVKCDVHPWMNAVVHVVKHPFFAITGENGAYSIAGLPPGDYTIEAIHETLGTQTVDVKVAAKESKDAPFTFKPKAQ
jgi:plastocyanin